MEFKSAEHYRKLAADCRKRSQESFERSDTDGFLSQWASDTNARLYDTQAEIVENGGYHDFPALRTPEGGLVPAKLIKGRYGWCWALTDENGQFTGQFIGNNDRAIKKAGYVRGTVSKKAWAMLKSNGYGLSGNTWVHIFPIDEEQGG